MTPFERCLSAAVGYYELGLHAEALAELDGLGDEAAGNCDVMMVRTAVLQSLGRWEQMELAARELCDGRPDDAQGFISLAYATRRAKSLGDALAVLSAAVERFPKEPILHFNLACYHAQLGDLERARQCLAEAIRLEPACRKMALTDPDLAAFREEMRQ